jgi:lysine-specific demethylase 8
MTTIDRIAAPPWHEFESSFVRRRQPVVLTDLMTGSRIGEIRTLVAVRDALGDEPLRIQDNYDALLFEDVAAMRTAPAHGELRLSAYLDLVDANPATTSMCMEQALSERLAAMAPWPAFASARRDDGLAFMFVGNGGNYARMHFDGDQRHVLLYQIAGEKRVFVAPPSAGPRLVPVRNFSALCVDQFSTDERRRLLDYVGGVECVLSPGEALFIPALHWHYVDYLTTSASISFRLGRNDFGRTLSRVHPTYRSQAVAAAFLDERSISPIARRAFGVVRSALSAPYPSPAAMYAAMERVVESAYARLCPEHFQGTYCVSGLDELERALGIAFYASEAADTFAAASARSEAAS